MNDILINNLTITVEQVKKVFHHLLFFRVDKFKSLVGFPAAQWLYADGFYDDSSLNSDEVHVFVVTCIKWGTRQYINMLIYFSIL